MTELNDEYIKKLIDQNHRFLTMLGYVSSIIFELQDIIEQYNGVTPERTLDQIEWFKTAIENIVYKDIPAPRMPK